MKKLQYYLLILLVVPVVLIVVFLTIAAVGLTSNNAMYENEAGVAPGVRFVPVAAGNSVLVAKLVSLTEVEITLDDPHDPTNDTIRIWQTNPDQTVDITISGTGTSITVTYAAGFDYPSHFYTVQFNELAKKAITGDPDFIDDDSSGFTPTAAQLSSLELGAVVNGTTSVDFKLWAPLATKVELNFYSAWDQASSNPDTTEDMSAPSTYGGVWELTLPYVDAYGKMYQYEVFYGDDSKYVLDPYAKNMAQFNEQGIDSVGKGIVVDPTVNDPADWDDSYASIPGYTKREDTVIYEVHVRDFTVDPDIESSLTAQFGTYAAFAEKLQYLKELGVTHIQLLPVVSYYYGNEADNGTREMTYSASGNNYNWGYDPHNYFSPEGMYSQNPNHSDPGYRIVELKELVQAIHDADMAVTLDVVYNHQAKHEIMDDIVPGYYYRLNDDGTLKENSGCRNDVASTHKMARKLIVDSIRYWTDEYKVDGYRFDLMGLTDTVTMTEGYAAASALNADTLFIGEGWLMYNGPAGTKGADQQWMDETSNFSVFSDGFRNTLKGGGSNEGTRSFLTGEDKYCKDVWRLSIGDGFQTQNDEVGEMVAYIAAHDGLTWYDTIAAAMDYDPVSDRSRILKRMKLGNMLTITAQGISFLHAGQEMGRTKQFKQGTPTAADLKEMHESYVRNSYDSSDIVNMIDWSQVDTDGSGYDLMRYTKGLIELKKSTDAFDRGLTVTESYNQTEYLIK
jgi:pullulanase